MMDFSQLRQMGLFDSRVPRYTSYPTSPQFTDAVDAQVAGGWLRAIPAGAQVSLYIHVPFCRRLCWFCACRTQGTSTLSPVVAYVDDLLVELATLRALLPAGVTLSRLHWGGGTPTLLPPEQIARLAGAIAEVLPFAEGAEFSVEIDPTEIDGPRLDALAAAGMNRASVGVQDFTPEIQKAIGRIQSYEETREAVAMIRARGVRSLNMDILYGLPHQARERIAAGTRQVISLAPDRVALYGYAHVPWVSKRQTLIDETALPGPEARLDLARTAAALFAGSGYRSIGMDHFALPGDGLAMAAAAGRLRRNFQGYTDDPARILIGLGASAISRYPQGYAQNAHATGAWAGRVRAGGLAIHKGHAFTAEDHLRGRIIEELMCSFRADLPALAQESGQPPEQALALAAGLPEAFPGLTTLSDGVLRIAPEAQVLVRLIAWHFDGYRQAGKGYSLAI